LEKLKRTLPPGKLVAVPWYETSVADFYNKTVSLFSKQVLVVKIMIGVIIVLSISNTMMMTVLERSSARTVVATENLSAVRFLFLTLFAPGAIQSVTCVERISPGVWGAYILVRTGAGASALASGHDASYVNRAVAIYRHLAGIPTDEEPPAAP
jgi:hypothetical protein